MKTQQLISSYDLELIAPPCVPGAATWSAKARLQDDISEVLPFLNAELKGADYNHDAKVLIWETKGKKCAFRPCEISAAPVEVREEAHQIINELIDRVNDVWERRHEIKPDFKQIKVPALMAVYKLLPRTNCRKCGYSTCMGYAADLRTGKAKLSQCIELSDEDKNRLSLLVGETV